MSSESSLERIFFECLQKDTPADRSEYLARTCAGDTAMLRRLQKMLEAQGSDFLERAASIPEAVAGSPTMADHAGQRIGAYRLVEQIGEGGMGTVWRGDQLEPVKRQVALKLIKAGMNSRQVIARFEAERQALALMDHPNIARVLDGGADEAGRPYFVMDLFAGMPITRYCDDRRLPVAHRLELFVQVCEAIQHAHQKGVIHRDIKPSNILVALRDGHAVPKVIDFGIAKAIEPTLSERTALTQQGGLIGTLEYMSPEQSVMGSGGVDTRSDIYSLGVLLFELLTGSTPLSPRLSEQTPLAEILRVIADDETPKPSTRLREAGAATAIIAAQRGVELARLASLVSGELDWIVIKALEKDRERRYATAADLAQDVQRFLAHEPVLACPPSAAYRLRKFARRHRGALAVASALVAALLVAIGGVGWALRDRAARSAEAEREVADRGARVRATVQDLLGAADRQMATQALSEALATVRRADAVATSGDADVATVGRIRALLQDLEFVECLDRVRSQEALWPGSGPDNVTAIRHYTEAFREHGLDIEGASVEAIIDRLGTTPALGVPLAAGLDGFMRRRFAVQGGRAVCRQITLAANTIDPEPVRASIRTAWANRDPGSTAELQLLVNSMDVRIQAPATIVNLAQALRTEQPATADRLLREAQLAHPGDFWLAFQLGAALAEQGNFEGALRYATAAVAIRPDSAVAQTNLGSVLSDTSDEQGATAAFHRAIELDPSLWTPHHNLGRELLRQSKPDEALASMHRAIELDPRNSHAWVGLGTVLLDMHQLDEAADAFQRAIELEPKSAYAHSKASNLLRKQGKLPEALASARQAVTFDPENSLGYVALGNALLETGEWAASAEAYRKAIELDPRDGVTTSNLGNIYSEHLSRLDEAIALGRKAVALAPRYAIGHNHLATCLHRNGQLEEALVAFRKAIELNPNFAEAYSNMGLTLSILQRPDEALAAYHKAIDLNPSFAPAHYNLGVLLAGQERTDEALAAFHKAVDLDPSYAPAHFNLGLLLGGQQRTDEALAAFHKAIEADPNLGWAHLGLGSVLRIQGRFDEAIGALEQAVRLGPRDPAAASSLAWLLATCPDRKLRDGDRAVELAWRAVELEPESAFRSRVLAAAHYRTGYWQDALDELQRAAELQADDNGFEWFVAAMAQWQLGDVAAARAAYDQGCEWMQRALSDDQLVLQLQEAARLLQRTPYDDSVLRLLQEEAAGLLGIEIDRR